MSKYNKKAANTGKSTKTVNHEGSVAYKLNAEMELYSAVATSMGSDNCYEKDSEKLNRIKRLISQVSPEFVAKLAVYARTQMHLRTIPMVLTVELAKIHSGDDLISRMVKKVVDRADELSELLATYQSLNSRKGVKKLGKLSNQLKKGLAECFYKFDEYQFSKYNKSGNEVKLRDVLFLTHPKPRTLEEAELFRKIANDELATADTWETNISQAGQVASSDEEKDNLKKEAWERLINERKLGYMAMLRNLRNIVNVNVSNETMNNVISYLTNEKAVANSKQLPFRFLAAYREFADGPNRRSYGYNNSKANTSIHTGAILDALEEAVKLSSKNLPFNTTDNVLIAVDVSGSMEEAITPKSSIERYDIGLLMAMTLQHKCRYVTSGFFGDTWKAVQLPKDNILRNVNELHKREGEVGYSTNGYTVLQWALQQKENYDKVIMFTDCQMWNSHDTSRNSGIPKYWNEYKKKNPNAKLYLFDLAGHGNTPIQVNENDVYLIAGFSDKIWDVLNAIENGESALSEIYNIEL